MRRQSDLSSNTADETITEEMSEGEIRENFRNLLCHKKQRSVSLNDIMTRYPSEELNYIERRSKSRKLSICIDTRDGDTDSLMQNQSSPFLNPASPFKEYSKFMGSSTESQSVIEDTDSHDGSPVQTEYSLFVCPEYGSPPAIASVITDGCSKFHASASVLHVIPKLNKLSSFQ